MLSKYAVPPLQSVFNHLGFDVTRGVFEFGQTGGAGAYTLGNTVIINGGIWKYARPHQRMRTLAHELTHSVQYEKLGFSGFLSRYYDSDEFWRGRDNYRVPSDLAAIPMGALNVVDPRFTLDQIAERVASEL